MPLVRFCPWRLCSQTHLAKFLLRPDDGANEAKPLDNLISSRATLWHVNATADLGLHWKNTRGAEKPCWLSCKSGNSWDNGRSRLEQCNSDLLTRTLSVILRPTRSTFTRQGLNMTGAPIMCFTQHASSISTIFYCKCNCFSLHRSCGFGLLTTQEKLKGLFVSKSFMFRKKKSCVTGKLKRQSTDLHQAARSPKYCYTCMFTGVCASGCMVF